MKTNVFKKYQEDTTDIGATCSIEMMTPALASRMLTKNEGNRKVSVKNVSRWARVMKEGRWILNGETVKVSASGRLYDGQHRLSAVVESGMTVPMFVVRDLPEVGVFQTIDNGKLRNGGDTLSAAGCEKHMAVIAAVLRAYSALLSGVSTAHMSNGSNRVENDEMLTLYYQHPDVAENVVSAMRYKYASKMLGANASSLCYHLFARVDERAAMDFYEAFNSGVGLHEGSAILALRNKMNILRATNGKVRVRSDEVARLVIAAWLAWRKDAEVQILRGSARYKLKDIV